MTRTVYSWEYNMTFIIDKTTEGNTTTIKLTGFYFGEPDDEATKKYNGKLTAVIEK